MVCIVQTTNLNSFHIDDFKGFCSVRLLSVFSFSCFGFCLTLSVC